MCGIWGTTYGNMAIGNFMRESPNECVIWIWAGRGGSWQGVQGPDAPFADTSAREVLPCRGYTLQHGIECFVTIGNVSSLAARRCSRMAPWRSPSVPRRVASSIRCSAVRQTPCGPSAPSPLDSSTGHNGLRPDGHLRQPSGSCFPFAVPDPRRHQMLGHRKLVKNDLAVRLRQVLSHRRDVRIPHVHRHCPDAADLLSVSVSQKPSRLLCFRSSATYGTRPRTRSSTMVRYLKYDPFGRQANHRAGPFRQRSRRPDHADKQGGRPVSGAIRGGAAQIAAPGAEGGVLEGGRVADVDQPFEEVRLSNSGSDRNCKAFCTGGRNLDNWRRERDSDSRCVNGICKLQIPRCRRCHKCQECHAALPTIAHGPHWASDLSGPLRNPRMLEG